MIVKKTKQLGSFKRGINLYVPRRSSSTLSGFPNVGANGQQINVSTSNEFAGIYTKVSSGNEVGYINASRVYNGPYVPNGGFVAQLVFNVDTNQWELGAVSDWTGEGNVWQTSRFNPSSNQNIIPTTGWNESVTITAA